MGNINKGWLIVNIVAGIVVMVLFIGSMIFFFKGGPLVTFSKDYEDVYAFEADMLNEVDVSHQTVEITVDDIYYFEELDQYGIVSGDYSIFIMDLALNVKLEIGDTMVVMVSDIEPSDTYDIYVGALHLSYYDGLSDYIGSYFKMFVPGLN